MECFFEDRLDLFDTAFNFIILGELDAQLDIFALVFTFVKLEIEFLDELLPLLAGVTGGLKE
jgi:hypothetical protein